MTKTYGTEIMDDLYEKSRDVSTWRAGDYQRLIDEYKQKLAVQKKLKGGV